MYMQRHKSQPSLVIIQVYRYTCRRQSSLICGPFYSFQHMDVYWTDTTMDLSSALVELFFYHFILLILIYAKCYISQKTYSHNSKKFPISETHQNNSTFPITNWELHLEQIRLFSDMHFNPFKRLLFILLIFFLISCNIKKFFLQIFFGW